MTAPISDAHIAAAQLDDVARLRQVAAAHLSLLLRGPRRTDAGDTVAEKPAYAVPLRIVEEPLA